MGDDCVATHWLLEHSDERAFGVSGRRQPEEPVATQKNGCKAMSGDI